MECNDMKLMWLNEELLFNENVNIPLVCWPSMLKKHSVVFGIKDLCIKWLSFLYVYHQVGTVLVQKIVPCFNRPILCNVFTSHLKIATCEKGMFADDTSVQNAGNPRRKYLRLCTPTVSNYLITEENGR